MSNQLLIYKTAVPVTRVRHGDWSVETGGNYSFSGEINSVPLMAVEFPQAATEYPIVFAGRSDELIPAVILGVRGNENLFLSKDSHWEAKYIPAFVRRYPFVFSRSDDRFVLCVDEEFPGFNQSGRGQKLFADDGKPSPYVENVLKFLQEYQAQFLRTQRFCAKVQELDLLEPMQAQVRIDAGQQLSLSGFMRSAARNSRRCLATSSRNWPRQTNWNYFICTCNRCATLMDCGIGSSMPCRMRRSQPRWP